MLALPQFHAVQEVPNREDFSFVHVILNSLWPSPPESLCLRDLMQHLIQPHLAQMVDAT